MQQSKRQMHMDCLLYTSADDEEFRMIKEIVIAIVKDYNQLRKELKLPYNEEEISSGVPII